MATVQFEGTVTGHFARGIRVAEQDGDYTRRWTVWTGDRPAENTPVTVTGELGTKTREYEGKTYVEHHVNRPHIATADGTPAAAQPATTQPAAGDDWWGTSSTDPVY